MNPQEEIASLGEVPVEIEVELDRRWMRHAKKCCSSKKEA